VHDLTLMTILASAALSLSMDATIPGFNSVSSHSQENLPSTSVAHSSLRLQV